MNNLIKEVEEALRDLEQDENYLNLCSAQKDSEFAEAIEWAKQHLRQELIMTLISSRLFPAQAPLVAGKALEIINKLKKKPILRVIK